MRHPRLLARRDLRPTGTRSQCRHGAGGFNAHWLLLLASNGWLSRNGFDHFRGEGEIYSRLASAFQVGSIRPPAFAISVMTIYQAVRAQSFMVHSHLPPAPARATVRSLRA